MTDIERAARLAQDELRYLRRENEILRAKVETMDAMILLFRTQPAYLSQGMGEDPVWLLDQALKAPEGGAINYGNL